MKCPGQDMQYWNEDAIYEVSCPECSANVEFYKDDTTRKCTNCGHRFVNPKMDFGCAAYCQFAEQCLGTLPEDFVATQDSLLKDKVAVEVKRRFKNDFAGIGFAKMIADFAEKIGKTTPGADMAGILCSAYLLTAGSPPYLSTQKETVSLDRLRDQSLQAAEEILSGLGAQQKLGDTVNDIINNVAASSMRDDDIAAQVVSDAYHLALLERQQKKGLLDNEAYHHLTEKLYTEQAQLEAENIFNVTHA